MQHHPTLLDYFFSICPPRDLVHEKKSRRRSWAGATKHTRGGQTPCVSSRERRRRACGRGPGFETSSFRGLNSRSAFWDLVVSGTRFGISILRPFPFKTWFPGLKNLGHHYVNNRIKKYALFVFSFSCFNFFFFCFLWAFLENFLILWVLGENFKFFKTGYFIHFYQFQN